jgi:menaquinone-dependent protoporphyrinogen IX oxidase
MENAKVTRATGVLATMRSINPNAQVAINAPIPNFPRTPNAVSQMTGTLSFPRFLFWARRID